VRKIESVFGLARRRNRRWRRERDARGRLQMLVRLETEVLEKGVRNVAILDYYLKHVNDERQLRSLDRWLAEAVLSAAFGGHKKGHFRKVGFGELRAMGLPSLLHRRRMIHRGRIASPFFIWRRAKTAEGFRGMVANVCRSAGSTAFPSFPEAAAGKRR